MPSTETHRCCVCAIETEIRCAACSAVGTDLFFCSKEHQKLVWKVHKRFCGKASFEHPLLEPEEAARAKRIAFARPDAHGITLARHYFGMKMKSPANERKMNAFIDAITASRHSEAEFPLMEARRNSQLIRICLLKDPSYDERDPLRALLAYASFFEVQLIEHLGGNLLASRSWYSPLMHQFTLAFALSVAPDSTVWTAPNGDQGSMHRVKTGTSLPPYLNLLDVIKTRVVPVDGKHVGKAVREVVDSLNGIRAEPGVVASFAAELGMEDCL
ncbi:hypothetical protein JCM10207_000213 [Rhodosporidiobolus poonsookiae]